MCELFGMSSSIPATVNLSLEEFAKHGGLTGIHKDGWGIAFYEDNDIQLLREASAASESPLVRFVREHGLTSGLVISHIRHATQGANALRNTQPFARELGGRMHVFAHNGDLKGLQNDSPLALGRFSPVGETDSEYAFCHLLELMARIWANGTAPSLQHRLDIVSGFAESIREYGPANFLYADGELLFAHGHKRTQAEGVVRPPGLHILTRTCPMPQITMDIAGLTIVPAAQNSSIHTQHRSHIQHVVLVASVPLTDEGWIPLKEGEILVVSQGQLCCE